MKKKFLALICFVYSIIIIYVWLFNKLDNFLAPNMQIYLKCSLIPMLIMGFVLLINNHVNYKFKISDIILLLPIIMLFMAGDGRLTASLASNRTMFNRSNVEISQNDENTETLVEEKEDIETSTEEQEDLIDTEKIIKEPIKQDIDIHFDINNETYYELANYISFNPSAQSLKGKTIRVRGFALKKSEYIPENYFIIGKFGITCCAADAGFLGFFVKYNDYKIEQENWYEIEGILEPAVDAQGYETMAIKIVNIQKIDSKEEQQYVYPCYSTGDGTCSEVMKYNLENMM